MVAARSFANARNAGVFSLAVWLLIFFTPQMGAAAAGTPDESKTDLDYAQVLSVEVVQSADGSWCIYTTVRHNDEGWDHYAKAWQVLDQKGEEVAWRLLAHPHDLEQPFERDKCGIAIADDVTKLTVQAKCDAHGFGGAVVVVDMSVAEGDKFKVVRYKKQPPPDGK